jgi:hypothetical protein
MLEASGSYQNYQNRAATSKLTDVWKGGECVGGDNESVNVS